MCIIVLMNSKPNQKMHKNVPKYQILIYGIMVICLGLGLGLAWILNHPGDVVKQSRWLFPMLYGNIGSLILLNFLVGYRLWQRWKEYRPGSRPKLHFHLLLAFSSATLIPAIVVAGFAAAFFQLGGISQWFGTPVRAAIQGAEEVIDAYVKENKRTIQIDALRLATILRSQILHLMQTPLTLQGILNSFSHQLHLEEIIIFDGKKNIVARSYLTFAMLLEKISHSDFQRVKDSQIVIHETKNRVRALIRLDPLTDTYLFVGKIIDPKVLSYIDRTQKASKTYNVLMSQHAGVSYIFIIYFSLIVILLLFGGLWGGLTLANRLFAPIDALIQGARQISLGDWNIRIEQKKNHNEIDLLISSFNTMVEQLQKQKEKIAYSQRQETWADIAKKIAHEIKNPLTPIQLSAERLKRRYSKKIEDSPEIFDNCIDTIIRQVGQIQHLVNEFSAFARMPEPIIKEENITHLCGQLIQFYQEAHPKIIFSFHSNAKQIILYCDERQFIQLISNLVQNCIECLTENEVPNKIPKIHLYLKNNGDKVIMIFEDNGIGFLPNTQHKLLDPYFTTRPKGTGLGLAIVSKIITDHSGSISFGKSTMEGAKVEITFPINQRIKNG
jgi:two-component system nitrogen regulation sensor histidine kinase NtrY